MNITKAALLQMFPRASADWINAFVNLGPMLCEHYGFNRLDWCHFNGQIAAETNGLTLRPMRENMRYTSAARILQIFSYRLGVCIQRKQAVFGRIYSSRSALARDLVNQPEALADIVYGGREGTPWMRGSLYIGRGPTQVTHLNGYAEVGSEIARQPGGEAFDLVNTPDLLATNAELGVRAAFADWHLKRLSRYARADDVDTLSDALNTGNVNDSVKPHGLARRRSETARAKAIWPVDKAEGDVYERPNMDGAASRVLKHGMVGEDVEALQARLSELNYAPGAIDGKFGDLTLEAVIALQAQHGLVADGIVGPRTHDILATTSPRVIETRQDTTKADLRAAGSETMQQASLAKKGSATTAFFEMVSAGTEIRGNVDQAKSFGEWLSGLSEWLMTPGGIKSVITLLICLGIYWSANRIEWARLRDHITGRNRGR